MKLSCTIFIILFIIFFAACLHADEKDVNMLIVSPTSDDVVAGKTKIRAEIYGEKELVEKVEFFVDRKLVATITTYPFITSYDFGLVPAEHGVKALGYIKGSVKLIDGVRTKAYKLSYLINVKVIEIHTSVFNKKNVPVRGLEKNAFTVYDNNVKQDITHFQKEKVPLNLVLLLDISASMKFKIDTAKEVTKSFISHMIGPADKVAFIAFNDEIHLMKTFTSDTADVNKSITSLQSEGGTALNDAIAYSLSLFVPGMDRRAIVLVSDGKDEHSHLNPSQMLTMCEKAGIPIFSIAQGQGLSAKELQDYLKLIAERTGGITVAAGQITELRKSFAFIEDIIKSQYLLGYQVNEKYAKGWHYLKVLINTPKNTVLYSPTMYLEQ